MEGGTMTRQLAEFMLRLIWLAMDTLEPYINMDYRDEWGNIRKGLMEQVVFIDLPGDQDL